MNHKSHTSRSDEAISNRCLQYLLGELAIEDSANFVEDLAHSPELGVELERQSELLCIASDALIASEPNLVFANRETSPAHDSVTPWIEAICALAACLLVAFVGWSVTKNSTRTAGLQEDVLIAEAWAETDSIALDVSDLDEIDLDADREVESEAPLFDEAFSWVVTAAESGVSTDG